jgi:hypothetical protein
MIPPFSEIRWSASCLHYGGVPHDPVAGKPDLRIGSMYQFAARNQVRTDIYLSPTAGKTGTDGLHPFTLSDSQIELSFYLRGRFKFGFVDVFDYAAGLQIGLFRPCTSLAEGLSQTLQIGPWAAASLSDDGLFRLFVGPGTPYAIPSLGTASWLNAFFIYQGDTDQPIGELGPDGETWPITIPLCW